jgi:hypothetical protein
MDGNPYAPPKSGMTNERELKRMARRRATIAAAIDGILYALVLDLVPVFVFGLALPERGIMDPRWAIPITAMGVYNFIYTWTGTGLGGLLTRTRESRQESLAGTIFVTLFRTVWPLPFAFLGIYGAVSAQREMAGELGVRSDLIGICFAIGPWVIPLVGTLAVFLQRDTWRLSITTILGARTEQT